MKYKIMISIVEDFNVLCSYILFLYVILVFYSKYR